MKYILGTLGVLILLIIAVVLIAGSGDDNTAQEGATQVSLTDFIDRDGMVTWTEQGKITGEETYKSIRITVSRSERRVELLSGYGEVVERSEGVANTQEAYDTFMRALSNAGFSRERKSEQKDSRGVCAMGKRYIYTLRSGGENELYLWSTTCSRDERGTFGGDDNLVRQLFQGQIANYREFIKGVKL